MVQKKIRFYCLNPKKETIKGRKDLNLGISPEPTFAEHQQLNKHHTNPHKLWFWLCIRENQSIYKWHQLKVTQRSGNEGWKPGPEHLRSLSLSCVFKHLGWDRTEGTYENTAAVHEECPLSDPVWTLACNLLVGHPVHIGMLECSYLNREGKNHMIPCVSGKLTEKWDCSKLKPLREAKGSQCTPQKCAWDPTPQR